MRCSRSGSGEDQRPDRGGWVGGWVGVSAGGEIGGAKVQREARVITTLCHTAAALLATDRFYFVWTTFARVRLSAPAALWPCRRDAHRQKRAAMYSIFACVVLIAQRPRQCHLLWFFCLNEIERIDLRWHLNCDPRPHLLLLLVTMVNKYEKVQQYLSSYWIGKFIVVYSYVEMVKIVCLLGAKIRLFCLFLGKFSWVLSRFFTEKVAF